MASFVNAFRLIPAPYYLDRCLICLSYYLALLLPYSYHLPHLSSLSFLSSDGTVHPMDYSSDWVKGTEIISTVANLVISFRYHGLFSGE